MQHLLCASKMRIMYAQNLEHRMARSAGASSSASPRRATNVTLPQALLQEARALHINLSQACERGLATEVAVTRRRRWIEENRAAMEAWNEHVAAKGLPLPADRPF
jgi:antitoxin CcdA